MMNYYKTARLLVTILLTALMFCLPALAEETLDNGLEEELPEGVRIMSGYIDQMPNANDPQRITAEGAIIIGDGVYFLAPDCIMLDKAGREVTLDSFSEGTGVSIYVDDSEMIVKMWASGNKMERDTYYYSDNSSQSDASASQQESEPPPSGAIKLEGNVWKN